MKILFTGITGFLGRCVWNTCKKYKPIVLHGLTRREWDFCAPMPDKMVQSFLGYDYFVHAGAAVHALKSLDDPGYFLQSNAVGTFHALEAARKINPKLFVYISTAEVLGEIEAGYSKEYDPLRPSNPYSASKAAGELLTQTYRRCYGLPTIICRSMNLYDFETQTDESKFVPMVKRAVLAGEVVKIHVKNRQPGTRQWMLGSTFAKELLDLLPTAEIGKTYHLVGEELTNLEMAKRVADYLGKPLKYEFVDIPRTHAHRYAMKATR